MDIVRNCFQNIDRKYDFYNRLRITALSIGARYYNRLQISATRIVDTVFFNRLRKTTARTDGGGFANVCENRLSSIKGLISGNAKYVYSSNAAVYFIDFPGRSH